MLLEELEPIVRQAQQIPHGLASDVAPAALYYLGCLECRQQDDIEVIDRKARRVPSTLAQVSATSGNLLNARNALPTLFSVTR